MTENSKKQGGKTQANAVAVAPKSGAVVRPVRRRFLRSTRYDATRPESDLDRFWSGADSRSVDASLDPETRRKLRERARYEVANNCYATGLGLTIANAVVGSGPRLQIVDADDRTRRDRQQIEWAFCEWSEEIRLAEKLRAMRFARYQDGEAFAILCNNPGLPGRIKLDVVPLDAERVCADYYRPDPRDVDGIALDDFGNPVSYRVATSHPGDLGFDPERFGTSQRRSASYFNDAKVYDAKNVVHWFRRVTSEQHRGAPEIAPALRLFALLRRYTLAVVTAAEVAADLAVVLTTDEIAGGTAAIDDPDELLLIDRNEGIPIARGEMTFLPEGYDAHQFKAEQPTTTYPDFKRELLSEIGRALQVPVNLVSGDSAKHNYASGRLDCQEFHKTIRLDQQAAGIAVMRPIFYAWFDEYAALERSQGRQTPKRPVVTFQWDGFEHVDPVKEADAQAIRLQSMTTTLADEYAKMGRDWEDALIQRKRELDKMRELGLTPEQVAPPPADRKTRKSDDEEGDDDD